MPVSHFYLERLTINLLINLTSLAGSCLLSYKRVSRASQSRFYRDSEYYHSLEVVLSLLIEFFRFSPAGEVVWQMTGLATPTVPSSGSSRSQLPLCIEKAQTDPSEGPPQ